MPRREPLVCQYLERVSRELLLDYGHIVRDFVRGRNGVYALYRGTRLSYVGLASDLEGRLRIHLADRHADSWDRFSVYLTLGDSHLKELESLLLRILRPQGNRQRGNFVRSEDLSTRLRRRIREDHTHSVRSIFDPVVVRRASRTDGGSGRVLTALERRTRLPITLRGSYRGRGVTATLKKDGTIQLGQKRFTSPSGAAKAVKGHACDGWTFWRFERAPGDWVRLDVLRRSSLRVLSEA